MDLQANNTSILFMPKKWLGEESDVVHGHLNGYTEEGIYHFHSGMKIFNYADELVECKIVLSKTTAENEFEITRWKGIYDEYFGANNTKKCQTYIICIALDNIKAGATIFMAKKSIKCEVHFFPESENLFSRHKGLLAYQSLQKKKVGIVGLGSFGSQIAIELTKAGVHHFTLIDDDRLGAENIVRHQCGIRDLGRFKTLAVKDAILDKNSTVEVDTFEGTLMEYLESVNNDLSAFEVLLCCTDNNPSRFLMSHLASQQNVSLLIGKSFAEAEGGDVFVQKGNQEACYCCHLDFSNTEINQELSSVSQINEQTPAYGIDENTPITVQIGLSSDINPIINQMVKMALLELTKESSTSYQNLAVELDYNYYIWANRRSHYFANWLPFNQNRNQPTLLRWYGAKIQKNIHCVCNQ